MEKYKSRIFGKVYLKLLKPLCGHASHWGGKISQGNCLGRFFVMGANVGAISIARDVEIKNSWQNEYVGAILIARDIVKKLQ